MYTSASGARTARRFRLAVIAGAIGLLGAVPAAPAAVRVGQNYRLNSDPSAFRGKDQVALAVDPANPQHIVETNANYLTENCEATASFDGGVTWTEGVTLTPPTPAIGMPFLPSCRISNHLGESMFQTVAFGSGQNVYATSITPQIGASFAEAGASALIFKSTDGGVTWGPGVVSMAGGPGSPSGANLATGPYYELPTLAVDPGAGTGGADRIYSAAHETTGNANNVAPCGAAASCATIRVAVSNDGGATFAAPVQASPTGIAIAGPDSSSEPVIFPDHSVNIAWRTQAQAGSIQIARSTNAGVTWGAPVTVTGVTNNSRSAASHVDPPPTPSTGSSFPRLAGDPQSGKLYIVYNQGAPGPTGTYLGADHFIPPDSHVYFQRSSDNGATWSTPKLIDDISSHPGTPMVQTRHPSITVGPGGRIDIVWEDRRHWYQGPGERDCIHTHLACDDPRLGDTYYAYSADGGTTFSPNIRVSDRSHNNDVGYDYRFGVGWAFGPRSVSVGSDKVLIGWMDSREGSYDTDNEDIYLAKVDLNAAAAAAVPQTSVTGADPVGLSVALSKFGYMGGGESLLASTFATRNGSRVVIVNQSDVAGATAGAVLARANLSPVLLSPASGLPDSVKSEVARLNPAGAFVIGDTGKLSDQVTADLAAAGVPAAQIVRLSGPGDADTAGLIAAQMDKRSPAEKAASNPAFDAAVIANPAGPDASAAVALAAARRLPILYVNSSLPIPSATTAQLASLNIAKTLVVGGPGQISDAVMGALTAPTRLGGSDQYATSRAVAAESVVRGLPSNVVYAADGARPMDGALLGAVVGRTTGIMLLTGSPVGDSVPAQAAAAGLSGIDRFVVVPAPAPVTPPPPPVVPPPVAPPPPPPPGSVMKPAVCGTVKLVKRNASKTILRVDTRVLAPCAGKLTARATTILPVKGKPKAVALKTTVKSLSGRNRSIRVSLSSAARSKLRRIGSLRVVIKTTFVPSTRSATSKTSRKTITVIVKRAG